MSCGRSYENDSPSLRLPITGLNQAERRSGAESQALTSALAEKVSRGSPSDTGYDIFLTCASLQRPCHHNSSHRLDLPKRPIILRLPITALSTAVVLRHNLVLRRLRAGSANLAVMTRKERESLTAIRTATRRNAQAPLGSPLKASPTPSQENSTLGTGTKPGMPFSCSHSEASNHH